MVAPTRPVTAKKLPKPSKFKAKKAEVDGIIFHSKSEARRYCELKILLKNGAIKNLELQKTYVLIPPQKLSTGKIERAIKYIADFVYEMNGQVICEDRKGVKTPHYVDKRKMMKWFHNVEILET